MDLSFIDRFLILESPSYRLRDSYGIRSFKISFYTTFLSSSSLLKELIGSACFSRVSVLDLLLPLFGDDDTESWTPIFSVFKQAFFSVKDLWLTEHTLDLLVKHPLFISTAPFPSLFALHVKGPFIFNSPQSYYNVLYNRFLQSLEEMGQPLISVLDLVLTHLKLPRNMDFLEEYLGLLVKWRVDQYKEEGEYRCGDGHPENLRFSDREDLRQFFVEVVIPQFIRTT
ncbi:hypothetical protein D9613_011026 [Agrocybe pediades]|uniref:Uncharacterized protein n=1 Tax=Agrocybe pediades TaxID=84607 RepID=A0A8H4QM63_9AGAR|nr:hypothetical protein D9613_011026 [Agrocybe pediades]